MTVAGDDMELDSAIEHVLSMLCDTTHDFGCKECRDEHVKLIEWLEELRDRRVQDAPDSVHEKRGGLEFIDFMREEHPDVLEEWRAYDGC